MSKPEWQSLATLAQMFIDWDRIGDREWDTKWRLIMAALVDAYNAEIDERTASISQFEDHIRWAMEKATDARKEAS